VALDEIRARDVNDRQAHLDLSYGYASIGYTLSTTGDTAGALENYQRALASRQRIASADPHDVNAADAVARAHLSIGRVLQGAGRLDAAIQRFHEAHDIAAKRYAVDPVSGAAAERLAQVLTALAVAQAAQASASASATEARRHWQEARASSKQGLDIWEQRAAKGPLSVTDMGIRAELIELAARSDQALARVADRPKP
jgi:tetratricopeptide (TPR) repeat protein